MPHESLIARRHELRLELEAIEGRVERLGREAKALAPTLVGLLRDAASFHAGAKGDPRGAGLQSPGEDQHEHLLREVSKPAFLEAIYRAAIDAYWDGSVS